MGVGHLTGPNNLNNQKIEIVSEAATDTTDLYRCACLYVQYDCTVRSTISFTFLILFLCVCVFVCLFVCFFVCHFSLRKFLRVNLFGKNLLLWPPQYFTPSDAPENTPFILLSKMKTVPAYHLRSLNFILYEVI